MVDLCRQCMVSALFALTGCTVGNVGDSRLGAADPAGLGDAGRGDGPGGADPWVPGDPRGDPGTSGDPGAAGDSDLPASGFCPPLALATGTIVNVATVGELTAAITGATDNSTIVMAAGVYQSNDTLVVDSVSHLTIRGATGNRDDVILRGPGYTNDTCSPMHFGIQVWSSPYLTLADFVIEESGCHGVQVTPGANDHFRLYRMTIRNTGQQNLKVSAGTSAPWADDGEVACSEISFTTGSLPYNNGVDVHGGWRWVLRDNVFRNLRATGGSGQSGPSILMWNGSADTLVERNIFVNCWEGIALGLNSDPSTGTNRTPGFQHTGGIVRNNVIINLTGLDAGIIVGRAKGVVVAHNTVWTPDYWASIESSASGTVGTEKNLFYNNLVTSEVALRFGDSTATSTVAGSLIVGASATFVGLATGNAHLASGASPIGAAVALPAGVTVPTDLDGETRPYGAAADVGADEWRP